MNAKEQAMQAEMDRLRAENAALKAKANRPLAMKISTKKALSVYGLGRFPVTLYKEQWLRLLAYAPNVQKFIQDAGDALSVKGDDNA